MGVISKLHCANCGYEPASRTVFQCPECRRVLEVDVTIDHLGRLDFARMRANHDRSIWRWFDFFRLRSGPRLFPSVKAIRR